MSSDPADPIAASSPPASPQDAPRHAIILLLIVGTGAIFVALFAILYVRWAGLQEPSSVMVVATTPAFNGAEIVVEGVALPEPYRAVVGSRSGGELPFYLNRGSYTLRIVRDEQTLYAGNFVMHQNQMLKIPLEKLEHLLPSPSTADADGRQTR